MSSPKLEEEGVLREWAPLSKLLQQIPLRHRQGMFFDDVKFTCVDATIECIVLGTNCGSVFWYDRGTHFVQNLRLEKGANLVTSVKVVSTVDFMVAAGDDLGVVSIFKLPKNIDGNQAFYSTFAEKIERYIVDGLHKSKVLALDWSINGQKLFSGDADGVVVFTEMDFVMNMSKAREIVNEKYSIVQLSYNQKEKILLISSELRSIIWRCQTSGTTVTQVGQRERPSLLPLGGTFVCDSSGDISIYSCRRGLKLWKADLDGSVKYTLLFKDALRKCKNAVKLLKPFDSLDNPSKSNELGKLMAWRDGLFVSYTKHNIIVIDPSQVSVAAYLLDVKDIVWACTTRTEVFVIGGKRDLIRLGYTPDLCDSSIGGFGNMALGEAVSGLPAVHINPVIGSPLSTSYTWNSYLSASLANSEPSSSEVNYGLDPAALPPIVSVQDGVPELRVEPSKYQQYTTIGQQGFDEVIFSQRRHSKHKDRRKSAEIIQQKFHNPKPRVISFNGVASYLNNIGKFLNGEFSPTICDGELENNLETVMPKEILPDLRNIEDIVEDVAKKEVLLEAMLESFKSDNTTENDQNSNSCNVSPVGSSLSDPVESSSRRIFEIELEKPDLPEMMLLNKSVSSNTLKNPESPSPNGGSSCQETVQHLPTPEIQKNECLPNSNEPKIIEAPQECSSNSGECDYSLVENKLKENSFIEIPLDETLGLESDGVLSNEADPEVNCAVIECDPLEESKLSFPAHVSDLNSFNGWCSLSCPEPPLSLTSWESGLVMCSPRLQAYIFSQDSWHLLNYKAESVLPSPTGGTGLKILCSLAHYSENWKIGSDWKKLGQDVQHAAVLDHRIWLISNGELFLTELKDGVISNYLSQSSLSKVYLYKEGLLFISENGRIFLLENEDWRLIRGVKNAKFLSVGPNNLIWVVDSRNILFVSDNIKVDRPMWWQVPVGEIKEDEVISLCSTNDSVYLCHKNSSSVLFNKSYVTGHRWIPSPVPYSCSQIAAGAVFEEKGCLWVLEKYNKLIALDSSLNLLKDVLSPCNVVCITSAPGALWLLSDDGSVYLRQGITDSNPVGVHWRKLNLEQLRSQIEIVGISCGPDVVWACDIRGKVVMLVGSPHSIANNTFEPAWVSVDGKPIDNNTFTKVYVGPDTYMVWALDNAGNIYVREAVFPTFPLGTGWVHVPHIKASYLTISSDAVYALTRDGVYKRIGISQSNYIGDGWLYIPVELDFISASFDLGLYGICSKTGNIVSHIEREFAISENSTVENDWALL